MLIRSSVLVLVLAAVAACDKVPLGAPTSSTITVNSSNRSIPIGGSTEVTAFVAEGTGTPVQNGTTVRFTTNLGTVEPSEALTVNGLATTTLRAGTVSGVAQVRATSGNATVGAGNVIDINIGGASAAAVTLSASSLTVPSAGGSVSLTAVVVDAQGNRVRGAPVSFTTSAGSLSPASTTTNENGEATVQLTTTTNATVTARSGTISATAITVTAQSATLALVTDPANGIITQGSLLRLTVTPAIGTGGAAPRVTVNWGDGTVEDIGVVSAARVVTHTYNTTGTFTVTATATVGSDETRATTSVTVNQRPVIAVNVTPSSTTPALNSTVTLTAGVTPAADVANVLRYEWRIRNGTTGLTTTQTTTGNELRFVVDSAATVYTVEVTVTTTDGRTGTGVAQFRST